MASAEYECIFSHQHNNVNMVSVIIPVYNTGKLLNKCVNSLLEQSYTEWECVLVDDCSTDYKTLELLQMLAAKDSRIRLIRNAQNQGIEKTRFVGLFNIKGGDYVMFMDHDDWLYDKESLKLMVENAEKTHADIVIGRYIRNVAGFYRNVHSSVPFGIIEQPDLKNKYYCSYFGVNLMPVLVWARLYKKELIDRANMKPHGLSHGDDVAWNLFIMPYANRVSIIDNIVYVHRWGGVSSKFADGLKEEKHFYRLRLDAIQKFDFPEGRKWLDIEAKNVLQVDLQQRMLFFNMKQQDMLAYIQKELEDPIWEMIEPTIREYCNDEFSQALTSKDVMRLFSLTKAVVNSPKNRIKQCLKSFLRVIG